MAIERKMVAAWVELGDSDDPVRLLNGELRTVRDAQEQGWQITQVFPLGVERGGHGRSSTAGQAAGVLLELTRETVEPTRIGKAAPSAAVGGERRRGRRTIVRG